MPESRAGQIIEMPDRLSTPKNDFRQVDFSSARSGGHGDNHGEGPSCLEGPQESTCLTHGRTRSQDVVDDENGPSRGSPKVERAGSHSPSLAARPRSAGAGSAPRVTQQSEGRLAEPPPHRPGELGCVVDTPMPTSPRCSGDRCDQQPRGRLWQESQHRRSEFGPQLLRDQGVSTVLEFLEQGGEIARKLPEPDHPIKDGRLAAALHAGA